MKEKINNLFRRNILQIFILVIITFILSSFVSQKEGYHMDELLSFELANAKFNPWIVPTQPEGRLAKFITAEIESESIANTLSNLKRTIVDIIQNRSSSQVINYQANVFDEPVWITRQQFRDYVAVDKTDDFNYLSVYFNVKDDNHPPLHFILLHTISSLFKDRITPFMGCIINIGAILGSCILMMKLGRNLGQEKLGIFAAILYGLSSGAIATTLLIRMYGIMTFMCVAFFYLNVMKWKEKKFSSHNKLLIAVTIMGFLSQYFFLFYCISLVVVMAIILVKDKQWKDLFAYIRSMVIAAMIGLVLFPFAIQDVFSSGRGVEALGNLMSGMEGYGLRIAAFGKLLMKGIFEGNVSGIAWCIFFLLLIMLMVLRWKEIRKNGSLLCLLIIPATTYFLLAAKLSPYLVDRYIMAIFPFFAILCAYIFKEFGKILEEAYISLRNDNKAHKDNIVQKALTVCQLLILIALCTNSILRYDGEYLYKGYSQQMETAIEYEDLACICIYDGVGYYENLLEFASYDKTLLITEDELEHRFDRESIMDLDEVIIIVKENVEKEKVRLILEEYYNLYCMEELLQNGVHGDDVWLCMTIEPTTMEEGSYQ